MSACVSVHSFIHRKERYKLITAPLDFYLVEHLHQLNQQYLPTDKEAASFQSSLASSNLFPTIYRFCHFDDDQYQR